MDRKEIEIAIKSIEHEMEILQKSISHIKSQLESEQPEQLRHGDYGYNDCNEPVLAGNDDSGPFCFGPNNNTYKSKYPLIVNHIGNIFDDLEALAEPLGEWDSSKGRAGESITMSTYSSVIWLGTCGNADWYSIEQAQQIHRNLGRLIYTAKMKEKK